MSGPVITIDPSSPIALHEQVAAALRRAITEGEAGPGDRLPPARDLAAVLGVNANTVLRALRTLRDEGLLEFPPRPRGQRHRHLAQGDRATSQGPRAHPARPHLGYKPDELAEMISQMPS
jgi:GntR family transcriptional regulator